MDIISQRSSVDADQGPGRGQVRNQPSVRGTNHLRRPHQAIHLPPLPTQGAAVVGALAVQVTAVARNRR